MEGRLSNFQEVIVVTGMHRSGTSAMMGLLNQLGIELGSDYLNPSDDNPKGFYENKFIVELNEEILAALNSSWDDVFLLPERWHEFDVIKEYKRKLKELIVAEFSNTHIFGIKDPRISKLLPLWKSIFKELDITPYFIICLRHPLEVAQSLKKRNGFSIEKSLLLWMNYMLDAEFYTRDEKRSFVNFDDLIVNSNKVLTYLSNLFNLPLYKENQKDNNIHNFIDKKLKHFTVQDKSVGYYQYIMDFYGQLLNLTFKENYDNSNLEMITKIRTEHLSRISLFYNYDITHSFKGRLNELEREKAELEREKAELERGKTELESRLYKIILSPEWKFFGAYYRFRDYLFPIGSRRRRFLKNLFGIFRDFDFFKKQILFKARTIYLNKALSIKTENKNKYDVIFFSIISWHYRFQRPQQIAVRFAEAGHRVFYVNINLKKGDKYSVEIISKNIFQITLPFINDTDIYQLKLEDNDLKILADCFEKLFSDFNIIEAVMLVEFPAWYPLVNLLKNKYNFPIIFDCLDEFAGFKNIKKDVVNYEDSLVKISDLCVATSLKLFQKHKELTKKIVLIKNGTDFEFFHDLPPNNLLSKLKKPIIGYYGAIAEWFDIESIEFVAKNRPDWNIVLIGRITNINVEQLKKYKNIHFIKEQPYSALPLYLYWFDVCLIPFKLNDLTLSTNPVKFYEYISSGKPVVTSNLPELRPYSDIAYISKNKEEFLANIECALNEKNNEIKEKRIKVGRTADWSLRFSDLVSNINSIFPLVSIIIVTYNNLKYTKLCIDSIFQKTAYPNFEIIIVDNASTDGTPNYLMELKNKHNNIRIILNNENLGFAGANNIGIKEAQGEYIILLNNDTIVTPGWITGLIKYFNNSNVGMVGPVTNSIGNEAKINVSYSDIKDLDNFAINYTKNKRGNFFEIPVLAMFCVAISRKTIERVGLLDEKFSVGMFEDDDYSLRVKKAGLKLICAEDVFIHHFGGATFSTLNSEEYQRIFEMNRKYYENKWNIKWVPHKYRNGVS